MYEQAYMSIGKGLRLVFFGEILTTVAGLFSWFGLSLIGLVLTIVGLGMAGQGDSGYQKAFHVTILHLAMVFLGVILTALTLAFMPVLGDVLAALIVLASAVLAFLSVYYVCATSAALLENRSNPLSMRADTLWKVYGVCSAVTHACALALMLPFLATMLLAGGIAFFSSIILAVAGVLYIVFLYQAAEVFLHW